jgi:hypothetical protein
MEASAISDRPEAHGLFTRAVRRLGALPTGVFTGAIFGALFGGVAGRILMRGIFLIDKSTDGAKTDFGTVGEITVGGTLTLLILTTLAGVFGGVGYVAIRRWLPWRSPVARGAFFGSFMMFGPGVIFVNEVDLQIFEPAVPIFAMFVVLIVLYGIAVAVVTDRIRPLPAVSPGQRVETAARWLVRLAAVGVLAMAVLVTQNVYDKGGTCLTGDGNGGCGARVSDD